MKLEEITTENPIHIIKASWLTKAELILLIFGRDEWQFFNTEIPKREWMWYHPGTHVIDTRTKKIFNILDAGVEKGLIYKTV